MVVITIVACGIVFTCLFGVFLGTKYHSRKSCLWFSEFLWSFFTMENVKQYEVKSVKEKH